MDHICHLCDLWWASQLCYSFYIFGFVIIAWWFFIIFHINRIEALILKILKCYYCWICKANSQHGRCYKGYQGLGLLPSLVWWFFLLAPFCSSIHICGVKSLLLFLLLCKQIGENLACLKQSCAFSLSLLGQGLWALNPTFGSFTLLELVSH